jgi:membrane protease YdiL (CAAX protease family)
VDGEGEPEPDFRSSAGLLDKARKALVVLGALLVLGGLAIGGMRVVALYEGEIDVGSEPAPLAPTPGDDGELEPRAELVRAEVPAGYDVAFQFCAEAELDERWDIELIVWDPLVEEILIRAPVDDELLKNLEVASWGSCVRLGQGHAIPEDGTFAIEAIWPNAEDGEVPEVARDTDVVARISANPPLGADDPWFVLFVLTGAFALALGLSRPSPDTADDEPPSPWRAVGGVIGLIVVLLLLAFVPWGGGVAAYVRGLVIAGSEVVLALLLVPPLAKWSRTQLLGLVPPRRLWMIAVAPIVGIVLFVVGRVLSMLIPATSEAAISSLVSFSSGALTMALISVVVPVAEELFFRGLVFGTVERRAGGAVAFGVTVLLFAFAHLPQAWGDWGAFTAIVFTSLGLTGLRWWTGSTMITIVAHLAHNAIISLGALTG